MSGLGSLPRPSQKHPARSDPGSRLRSGDLEPSSLGKSRQVSARAPPYDLARLARPTATPHTRRHHQPRPRAVPARPFVVLVTPLLASVSAYPLTVPVAALHGRWLGYRPSPGHTELLGFPTARDLVRTSSASAPPSTPGAPASRARESARPFLWLTPGPSTSRQPVGLSRPAPSARSCTPAAGPCANRNRGSHLGLVRLGAEPRPCRAPARLRSSLGRSSPADPAGTGVRPPALPERSRLRAS